MMMMPRVYKSIICSDRLRSDLRKATKSYSGKRVFLCFLHYAQTPCCTLCQETGAVQLLICSLSACVIYTVWIGTRSSPPYCPLSLSPPFYIGQPILDY